METMIKGYSYTLNDVFGDKYAYVIPNYQRPYAWTTEEAGDLFDDLYRFYKETDTDSLPSNESSKTYFLGSVVLIKSDKDVLSDVIDGQQRLTTLSILFSVLAWVFDKFGCADEANLCRNKIYRDFASSGSDFESRIKLRTLDNYFFESEILKLNVSRLLKSEAANQKTESKMNLVKNARLFLEKFGFGADSSKQVFLPETDIDDVKRFCEFLCGRCSMVVVETPDRDLSFRIFSVLNNRGMSLLETDIIKSDVIGALPEKDQKDYSDKWERYESEISRDGFKALFGHLRTIFTKRRAEKSLLEEFKDFVLPNMTAKSAKFFIDDTLAKYVNAYKVVKKCDYSPLNEDLGNKAKTMLVWLNMIDNSDWVPLALFFYVKNPDDPELFYAFLRKLERLAVCTWVTLMRYTSRRAKRYCDILKEIDDYTDGQTINGLELTDEEKHNFRNVLESNIYSDYGSVCRYLVLRANSLRTEDMIVPYTGFTSIEHVLPQRPSADWDNDWPIEDDRKYWLNKIGNLVPLSRHKNSQAQNYSFEKKKNVYFDGKNGASHFALTMEVTKLDKWTPEIVAKRQDEIIQRFDDLWQLK